MKKIIPIISIISAGVMLTGCSNSPAKLSSNELLDNVNTFQNCVENYTKNESESLSKIALGKYELTVSAPLNATLVNGEILEDKDIENKNLQDTKNKDNSEKNIKAASDITSDSNDSNKKEDKLISNNSISNPEEDTKNITENTRTITPIENKTIEGMSENREIIKQNVQRKLAENNNQNNTNKALDTNLNSNSIDNATPQILNSENTTDDSNEEITDQNQETEKISTLYSLSADIEDSCDEFCELKEDIVDAIIETQNLISKVQSKEIELTAEQRIFLSEQSNQLKSLARRLSNITTELSLNLTDLSSMVNGTDNFDTLSLKYLIVLDNLVNGNELLENGLQSLNMINNLIDTKSDLAPNNRGRILYGFKRNNEEPIIKDYIINEDGNIEENNIDNSTANNEDKIVADMPNEDNQTIDQNKINTNNTNNKSNENNTNDTKNTDTYQNNRHNTNIDTYGNRYRNTDTFFNTALLDNEFMYGRGGYPYGNNAMYNYNGINNNINNLNNNVDNQTNNTTTESVDNNQITQNTEEKTTINTVKKQRKLTKNIDTYKDENTPTLSAKLKKFKQSVSNFFSKLSLPKKEGQYKNPIYKYSEINNISDIDDIK